jgi:aspartate kinase
MIVMKFGGTSVEDGAAIRKVVDLAARERERRPLIVASAMAGVTNGLLAAANAVAAGRLAEGFSALGVLWARHDEAALRLIPGERLAGVRATLEAHLEGARATLSAILADGRVAPRLSDELVSRGELMSSLLVAEALGAAGVRARWVDVRPCMRTDDRFTSASVLLSEASRSLAREFAPVLDAGVVPVTQGFVGATASGVTTTIGRGGSDYSASVIGAALGADEIQIWTDVDGIMTTDPRVVPEAAKIRVISVAEASELAYFGAKVLHPSTLRPATARGIPVRVLNSRRPDGDGTAIVSNPPLSRSIVKAIAFKRGITVVNLTSDRMLMAHGFLARFFEVFSRHEAVVDVVATSEVSVSVTVDDARRLDALLVDLRELGEVAVERDQAIICMVGERLKSTPGVAARIFSCLGQINVPMISHGASAINLTFVVAGDQVEEAVARLHEEFFFEIDDDVFERPATRRASVR